MTRGGAAAYNGQMRGLVAAVAVAGVLTLAACGSSSIGHGPPIRRGAGAARLASLLHDVRAARSSNYMLSIFPVTIDGHRKCSFANIPGPTSPALPPLHGLCWTKIEPARNRHEPLEIVTFTERLHWPGRPCQRGAECLLATLSGRRQFSSWIVWVKPPTSAGQKPRVVAMHQRGWYPPQAPKK